MVNLNGIAVFMLLGVGALIGLAIAGIVLLAGLLISIPAWLPWVIVTTCTVVGGIVGFIMEATP